MFFFKLYYLFLGTFTETLETNEIRIERCLFASQEYTELLLSHVVLTRLVSKGQFFNDSICFNSYDVIGKKIVVPAEVNEQVTSIDIDFTVETRNPQYV